MITVIFDIETAAVRPDDPAWLARAAAMRADVEAKVAALLAEPVTAAGNLRDPEKIAASIAERTAKRDADVAALRDGCEADIEAARMATALDPTLGRVVCVAWTVDGEHAGSVSGDNERGVLMELWGEWSALRGATFVAHNGKRFDVPFLRVRALHHGLPHLARVFGGWAAKPWDLRVVDTVEAWPTTGSEAKGQRRLPMLARLCGVDCAPDTITGADVPRMWESGDPDARRLVVDHCVADVLTLARVWSVLSGVL